MVLFWSVEAGDGEAEKENYAPTSWQALNLLCQRRLEVYSSRFED